MKKIDIRKRLWTLVDETQEELLQLCADLVRHPNVNPPIQPEAITAVIENYFRKYHVPYEKLEPYKGLPIFVASVGDGNGKTICINGHTDTVPPGDLEKWEFDPYCGTITDTQVWGRGTSDMLCGVAIGMHMARLIVERNIQLHGKLILHLVPDEECGGERGSKWLVDNGYADGVEGVLLPEPTSWNNFETGQKGSVRYIVTCKGTPILGSVCSFAHDHAIFKMMDLLGQLEEMRKIKSVFREEQMPVVAYSKEVARTILRNEDVGDAIDHVTYNVNYITCGKEHILPVEQCEAKINFGIPVGVTNEQVKEKFDELIKNTGHQGISYEIIVDRPSNYTPPEAEIVRIGLEHANELVGRKVDAVYQWASSDARWYRYKGIPALQYGPANIDGVHGYNETADIEEIMNTQKTYWGILADMLGAELQ